MTPAADRLQLMSLVQEALDAGARLHAACQCVGISERTRQRWQCSPDDRRPTAARPVPKNRLSAEEEQQVLAVCHEPRFASLPPAQIVPMLADEGRYIASESTFYRILRRYGEVSHRGRQQAPQSRPLSTWKATAPNQVWSWDITWLKSLTAGHWFYLYLTEDLFSRKIVGHEVHPAESGEYAHAACQCVGISERTRQRWQCSPDDRRPTAARPVPKNRLSAEEEQQVLAVCHEPRFASLPPAQIVPMLADEGRYIASESTFYRILRRYGEVSHRGRQQAPQSRPLSTWKATAPNQVWSWDITWLKSLTAGHWFYLYLTEDLFSRKIVGHEVHPAESGEYAAELVKRTVLSERCWQEPLVLHADNGAPMKSQVLQVKLAELKITPSHSRPRVSNDNAHVESLFRTLKYVPAWPEKGFASLEEARAWVESFVGWYNEEHRHSGIRYVTPGQRHRGEDSQLLSQRKLVYEAAKMQHPHRWSGATRNWSRQEEVWLNPEREKRAA
ncbi:Integrase core domain [Serratia ficaria]|nr:Integrase core domain [Serratia ficaria]